MARKGVMPAGLRRYWASHRKGKKVAKNIRHSRGLKVAKRRGTKVTIPLAVVAGLIPPVQATYWGFKYHPGDGNPEGGVSTLVRVLTGISIYEDGNRWQPKRLWYGLIPILAGFGVHKLAGKLGINRAIGQAGIPFVRI